jgi:ferredoxin-NADP reductase
LHVLTCSSIRRATDTTRIVRLDLGSSSFTYRAGQAAFLGIAGGTDRKPYSLASAPEDAARERALEFLIKLENNGSWGAHLAGLNRGAAVSVHGPIGDFTFPAKTEERDFLFVAGGTGIAPLRSMIRHAVRVRQPGRLRLLYSARTPGDFAFLPELRGMSYRKRLELALTATREVPARWRGDRGRITVDRLAAMVHDPETLCFVCGPAAMVDDVPRMLQELGIDKRRIRIEEW